MNLFKGEFPLNSPLISLLVFLVLSIFVLAPLTGRVKGQVREFINNRAALPEYKSWEQNRPLCEAQQRALQKRIAEAGLNEPKDRQIAQLFESLSRTAAECGVRLTRVKPGPESLKSGVLRLAIQLSARADFHKIGTFLNRLEQSDRPVRVTGFQLSAPRLDDAGLDAIVDLEGFFVLSQGKP